MSAIKIGTVWISAFICILVTTVGYDVNGRFMLGPRLMHQKNAPSLIERLDIFDCISWLRTKFGNSPRP